MKRDYGAIPATASALLLLGPAQDVQVDCGRALGLAGDVNEAQRLLVAVAHDPSCPPSIRADAYNLLVPLVVDRNDWTTTRRFYEEWVELRPTDYRTHPWAPTIANRSRTE